MSKGRKGHAHVVACVPPRGETDLRSAMSTGRRIAEAIHIVSLGVWLGVLAMTGATAATVFPLMRELNPTLGAYPAYGGPHAPLAAGHVVSRAFAISDIVQLAGFVLAGGSLAVSALTGLSSRRVLSVFRIAVMIVLACTLAYQFAILNPRMQDNLAAYWSAAAAGEDGAAETARQAFAADHPTASRVMSANALLTFIALVAAAWSVTSPTFPKPARPRPTETPNAPGPPPAQGS